MSTDNRDDAVRIESANVLGLLAQALSERSDERDAAGNPLTLAAAVADAGEWLELLIRRSDWLNVENRERCRAALAALMRHADTNPATASGLSASAFYEYAEDPDEMMHYHKGLPDDCAQCGRDVSDPIHLKDA